MPIYEYRCDACGHCFEMMRRVSDTSTPVCPNCQAKKVKKLVSAPSFQLKGTGWYATDFKDKKPSSEKEKNQESKEASQSNESKPSETKKEQPKSTEKKKTDSDK